MFYINVFLCGGNILNPVGFNPNLNYTALKTKPRKQYNMQFKEPEKQKKNVSTSKLLTFVLLTMAALFALKNVKSAKKILPKAEKDFTIIEAIPDIKKPKQTIVLNKIPPKEKPIVVEPPVIDMPVSKPGDSAKRILALLKNPLRSMEKKGIYDPQEIDRVLTSYVGDKGAREIRFFADPSRGVYEGRKKSYRTPDGNIFVLESHSTLKGIVTRFYQAIKPEGQLTKGERLYLSGNGSFLGGKYYSKSTHLQSDENALNWIRYQ